MAGTGLRGSKTNQRLDSAQVRRKIVRLRRKFYTFQQISDELGMPLSTVYKHWRELCKAIPTPDLEAYRTEMMEQLDQAEQVCLRILHETGYKVSASGKVVFYKGMPLKDRTAALDAAKTLVRIQERKARLLGADSEQKVKSEVKVNYTVSGVSEDDLR